MTRRHARPARWLVLASTGLIALATAMVAIPSSTATQADGGAKVCRKFESPRGTITIDQDGLVMTLEIGTFPDLAPPGQPNPDNAVTAVVIDPSSAVTSGTITVKGGPRSTTYAFTDTPPLHAPALTSNGKWPTISYVEVCWTKPVVPKPGAVKVTKVVTGADAPTDQTFTITLTPTTGDPITKTITGAGTVVFADLSPGTYTLSEADLGEGWTVTIPTTTLTVTSCATTKATITNAYTEPPPEPTVGTVEVTKLVTGADAPTDQTFTITVTPTTGDPITKTITGAGTVVFDDLSPGTYTLSEADPGEGWTVTIPVPSITVVAGETATAEVTNAYTEPPPEPTVGTVEVTKLVTGADAPTDQTFTITLTPTTGDPITKTITGAGTVVFDDLSPGTYTLSEADPGGEWDVTIPVPSITVIAGQTTRAEITNDYVAEVAPAGAGTVVVTKLVTGNAPSATYSIGLIGPAPATTEHWRTIIGAGEVVFRLPVGRYTVVERDPGSGYTVTISPSAVDVISDGVVRATVTNAYQPATVAEASATLPQTGSNMSLIAVSALVLLAGGTALLAVAKRRS